MRACVQVASFFGNPIIRFHIVHRHLIIITCNTLFLGDCYVILGDYYVIYTLITFSRNFTLYTRFALGFITISALSSNIHLSPLGQYIPSSISHLFSSLLFNVSLYSLYLLLPLSPTCLLSTLLCIWTLKS